MWKRNERIFKGVSKDAEDIMHLVFLQIAKWVSCMDEFDNLKADGIYSNREASLLCGVPKVREVLGVFKFNVGGGS